MEAKIKQLVETFKVFKVKCILIGLIGNLGFMSRAHRQGFKAWQSAVKVDCYSFLERMQVCTVCCFPSALPLIE